MTFQSMCFYITFSSVSVAEWQPFWKIAAHSVDHMFSCILNILNISYFPFWFLGMD